MKALLVGYSNIAVRRVLPALVRVGAESIDVVSRSAMEIPPVLSVQPRLFRDYDQALRESGAELAYISVINSEHANAARKALQAGFHVVVDKPAFLSVRETTEIIELATRCNLCLAEATVFAYDPRFRLALEAFEQAGTAPTAIVAAFMFPPFAPDNFRNRKELGGGALWDLGPYAVALGRLVFNEDPVELFCRINSEHNGVDTSFSMMSTYPGGRSCLGSFGSTTGYINRVDLIGPTTVATFERSFSLPAHMSSDITIRRGDKISTLAVAPADTFGSFFKDIAQGIASGDYRKFSERMLIDSELLDRLRRAALGRSDP